MVGAQPLSRPTEGTRTRRGSDAACPTRRPRCHSRGELSDTGWRRDRGGQREDLLEKVRGDGVQRLTLGLRGFDQLEETARLAWALQVNREPDTDRVVGRLEGLLSRLLGYILEGRGHRAVERPAVASH